MNKNIKNTLKDIEEVLNTHEEWEDEFWTYKLELKKNEIECKIYDDKWLEYVIKIEAAKDTIDILKGFINYLYENEINHRQSFVKGSDAFNRRKIKSLSTWSSRDNETKCKDIQEELVSRFNINRHVKSELERYKKWVSDFYSCLNYLCKSWKTKEVKEAIFDKLKQFDIRDVAITYVNDTISIYVMEDDNIKDDFSIEVDSYTNKAITVNNAINTIRKMKVA